MTFSQQSRQLINDLGFIKVVKGTFHESTTGNTFDRTFVDHIGAAAVVPVLDNGDIVLINQYRAAIDAMSLEAVAGRRDVENENLENCVLRELAEEVALTAQKVASLGSLHTSVGYSNEVIHLFMATGITELGATEPDGIEEQLSQKVITTLEQALNWTRDGMISDSKTIIILYRLAEKLGYDFVK